MPHGATACLPGNRVDMKVRVGLVAAANKHSVAVTLGGEVYTFGANHEAQLGYGTPPNTAGNPSPRVVDALKVRASVLCCAVLCCAVLCCVWCTCKGWCSVPTGSPAV